MERLVPTKPDKSLCRDCPVGRRLGKLNLCKGMETEILYANPSVEGGPTRKYADEINPDDPHARGIIIEMGACEPVLVGENPASTQMSQEEFDNLGTLIQD